MPIEDVFSISGRGTVVTGRVERGIIKVGEEIEIVGIKETETTTCTGVEMFRKLLDEGRAGENVGVLLRGPSEMRSEVRPGCAGTITLTLSLKRRCTFCLRTRVVATRHSSRAIVPSFTSVRRT